MSKRTERRESERATRKLAFQQLHQSIAAAATTSPVGPEVTACMEAAVAQTKAETNRANAQTTMAKPSPTGRPETMMAKPSPTGRPETMMAKPSPTGRPETSTGPTTPEGKATVSQNRRSHGLTGSFQLLPTEDMLELKVLTESVYAEFHPETGTEQRLADSLIRHYWLMQRALNLQDDLVLNATDSAEADAKRLALFMRYQTTHERSYYRAQKELQNLRKQKQNEQAGFESQNRRNEALEAKIRLDHARALVLEVDAACRQAMEAPIPGTHNIPFADIAKACGEAISVLAMQGRQQAAAH